MASGNLKSSRKADTKPEETVIAPWAAFFKSDLFFAPTRAAAHMMAQAEQNTHAFIALNRKLADGLRGILRHEQDAMLDLSEKMIHQFSEDGPAADGEPENRRVSQAYDSAIKAAREMNELLMKAQGESLAALREYAQSAAEMGREMGRKAGADIEPKV